MMRLNMLLAFGLFAGITHGAELSKAVPTGWIEDFEAAKVSAAKEGKFILAAFSGSDWCGFCKRLDSEVFSQTEFTKKAAEKYVLVMIDSPRDKTRLSKLAAEQNPDLVRRFGIRGYPTVIIADAYGDPVCRSSGYKRGGPEGYLKVLDELMAGKTWPRPGSPGPRRPESERQSAANSSQSTAPRRNKAGTSTPEGWVDDYYAAKETAKKSGKRIFIVFSGSDWCGFCRKLERELLSQKTFMDAISPRYVPVFIDSPRDKTLLSEKCREQNPKVESELGARGGRPNVRILDADGNLLADLGGAGHLDNGVESYLKFLRQMEKAIEAVAVARRKCAEIMYETLSQLDESLVHDKYLDELKRIVAADPARYADKYPYVSKVLPLERKAQDAMWKFNRDCNMRANKMQREGRKESYQKLREEASAAIKAEGVDYITPINDVIDEIRRLECELRSGSDAKRRLFALEERLLKAKSELL